MVKHFFVPTALGVVALVAVFAMLGTTAFFTALLLVLLEITLSFDNAVVNAKVLQTMSHAWQQRFLTWGMLIAVFFTRLILPILIVSVSVWVAPIAVAQLALFSPGEYAHLLGSAHDAINAFGAAFLLMVSLKYFLDAAKTVHWMRGIERRLALWGKVEAVEIGITLIVITLFAFLVPHEAQSQVLIAGIVGVVLFIFMRGVAGAYSEGMTKVAGQGLALFIYLNILDTAFSLDSVVGAFALTNIIPVIVVGLGIGAYFVRSLTVYLVEQKALDSLIYLEHGAHWAIFGLAGSMFASLVFQVPEIVTGTIGTAFVLAAYVSSLRIRKRG